MKNIGTRFIHKRTCRLLPGLVLSLLSLFLTASIFAHLWSYTPAYEIEIETRTTQKPIECKHDIYKIDSTLAASGVTIFNYKNSFSRLLENNVCMDYILPSLIGRKNLKIYTYHLDNDQVVSFDFQTKGTWERDLVETMLAAMKMSSDMVLVDLGCNIGAFTVAAAAAGFDVIALDAFSPNHRLLQKSLQRNNLTCKVIQIHNALYSKRGKMAININHTLIGMGRVGDPSVKLPKNTHREIVHSICLDDLVPLVRGKNVFLKVDLEMSEHHVVQCSEAFFKSTNIKIIQFEWRWYRARKMKETAETLKKFFTSKNMIPFRDINRQTRLNLEHSSRWPKDIYWVYA